MNKDWFLADFLTGVLLGASFKGQLSWQGTVSFHGLGSELWYFLRFFFFFLNHYISQTLQGNKQGPGLDEVHK